MILDESLAGSPLAQIVWQRLHGPTETDESMPLTGLLGPQVRRVRPRAEHDVRTYRFLPADTRCIRIWNITYHTYIRIWYIRPRVKKSRRRYISSNGKSKRKCWYIYQVREQTIFYSIYKFPDRLVGGSDSAFVSTAAAELKLSLIHI